MTADEVLSAAVRLPPADRLRLIEALAHSLRSEAASTGSAARSGAHPLASPPVARDEDLAEDPDDDLLGGYASYRPGPNDDR